MKISWVSWIFVLTIAGQYVTADKASCTNDLITCYAATIITTLKELIKFPDDPEVTTICKTAGDAAVCIPEVVKSCKDTVSDADKLSKAYERFKKSFCVEGEFMKKYSAKKVCLKGGLVKFINDCAPPAIDSTGALHGEVNAGVLNSDNPECRKGYTMQKCMVNEAEKSCDKDGAEVMSGVTGIYDMSVTDVCGDAGRITSHLMTLGLGLLIYFLFNGKF